jgi:O-antigen/teichoic acid export membrane protein
MNGPVIADPPLVTSAPPVVITAARELKRGAFINTIALLASNFRGVFTFLVARLLGPAVLGTFSVGWATLDLVSKIGTFGLDTAIVALIGRSEATHNHARSRIVFQVSVFLTVVQCICVAAIVAVLLPHVGVRVGLDRRMATAIAITVCALPGVALYRVSTAASRSMKVMQHDIFSRGITESLVTTVALLVAIAIGATRFAPQYAAIVGTAASGTVAFLLARRLFKGAQDSATATPAAAASELLRYSAPIALYQLVNVIIMRLDVILLGCFIGRAPGVTLASVGVYGAAIEAAAGLRKINQAFNPMFAPIVSRMTATHDHASAAHTYDKLATWMLWILLPAAIVMAIASSAVMLIFGPAFRAGAQWLGIVAAACALNAFVSLGEIVIMLQRPLLNLIHSIISVVTAVAAGFIFIPRFGVTGAAYAILTAYLVQGVLRYYALRFTFGWRSDWRLFVRPFAAAGIAVVPALLARRIVGGVNGEIVGAAMFLVVFGGAWLLARRTVRALEPLT